MKAGLTMWIALAALCGASTLAHARPPTVTTSPGYDARLQQSRSALGGSPATAAPVHTPVAAPKHSRTKHSH